MKTKTTNSKDRAPVENRKAIVSILALSLLGIVSCSNESPLKADAQEVSVGAIDTDPIVAEEAAIVVNVPRPADGSGAYVVTAERPPSPEDIEAEKAEELATYLNSPERLQMLQNASRDYTNVLKALYEDPDNEVDVRIYTDKKMGTVAEVNYRDSIEPTNGHDGTPTSEDNGYVAIYGVVDGKPDFSDKRMMFLRPLAEQGEEPSEEQEPQITLVHIALSNTEDGSPVTYIQVGLETRSSVDVRTAKEAKQIDAEVAKAISPTNGIGAK